MKRELFEFEHKQFRASFRAFLQREVVPFQSAWEQDHIVPRELFRRAGEHGFLGMATPEEFGGAGAEDFRFNAVIAEEIAYSGTSGCVLGIATHNDICLPYLLASATEEQRHRWLPGTASGEMILALAMTEPGTGSDLAGIATTARADGENFVVNGSKTFITNAVNADLVITAVRTDAESRHGGLSLLVLEKGMPGFRAGRPLAKLGQHAQDTAELFFDDVRVPRANLLGEEGAGFELMTRNLAAERLGIAVLGLTVARAALGQTIEHARERQMFGRTLASMQNTRFVLGELSTEIEVTQSFVDDCIRAHNAGTLSQSDAASAKWWCTELQNRAVDRCLQLFGGNGYMLDYPIARSFLDSRITRIYGGTTEIMKEVVGRSIGL